MGTGLHALVAHEVPHNCAIGPLTTLCAGGSRWWFGGVCRYEGIHTLHLSSGLNGLAVIRTNAFYGAKLAGGVLLGGDTLPGLQFIESGFANGTTFGVWNSTL